MRPHQGVGREKLPPLEVTAPAQPTASSLNTNLHQNPDNLEFERNTGDIIREKYIKRIFVFHHLQLTFINTSFKESQKFLAFFSLFGITVFLAENLNWCW